MKLIENDSNEALMIRIAASRSAMPYSEYIENVEDLLSIGYSVKEAIDLLRDAGE